MKQAIVVLVLAACIRPVPVTRAGVDAHWCGTFEAAMAFIEAMRRPAETGPEFVYSDRFLVHFDTIGEHATTRSYAESVSVYAEEIWRIQVDSLGRIPPPPDRGEGGDDRYDIYLRNIRITGFNSSSDPKSSYVPDHPGVSSSFIVIKRDIADWYVLRGAVIREFSVALYLAAMPVQVLGNLED